MPDGPSQINRPFRVKIGSLGDDDLLLDRFTGVESVSDPFRYVLRMLSTDANLDIQSLLSQPAVLTIELADNTARNIHGNICRMKLLEYGEDGYAAYEAEMVPWFWFLMLFSDCRIFSNMNVPDIVAKVFSSRGFNSYRFDQKSTYPVREYCVQYRETDLNFVSRLLEEEGIFYFFEHTNDKHTMVLADDASSFAACPSQPTAQYAPAVGGVTEEDVIFSLESECRVQTGTVTLTDYDFTKPAASLLSTLSGEQSGEAYDYPGKFSDKTQGDVYARVRLEEFEAGISKVRGKSNCMGLESGYKFTLDGYFRDSANIDYSILTVEHQGRNTSYRSTNPDPFEYRNSFEAIPNTVPFRPARRARKPVIDGTQTAVVVSSVSGEEICVDQYGRILVQFFWEHEGFPSCWIRVAQGWAGKDWGFICIPRVGQEVVVSFLEGDPDRPLITGSVYNADQTPPYKLPDFQTKSTWKSMSSKGGGGFNELRFEDNKGGEQIFIHAERDLHQRIKNDRYETILNDAHLNITQKQYEQVGGDSHIYVKGDQNNKIDGTYSLNSGMDHQEKAAMNFAVEAGVEMHLKAGVNLVIESGTSLTLKVGGSFINLMAAGVFISGPMVFINSGGSAGSAGSANPTAPQAPTDAVNADPGAATATRPLPSHKTASMTLRDVSSATGSAAGAGAPVSPAAAVLQEAAVSGAPFCDT